jgi:hypothetical protein
LVLERRCTCTRTHAVDFDICGPCTNNFCSTFTHDYLSYNHAGCSANHIEHHSTGCFGNLIILLKHPIKWLYRVFFQRFRSSVFDQPTQQ